MATYRQDMAPPGGYKDIEYTRFVLKRPSGMKILGAFVAVKALGLAWFLKVHERQKLEKYEDTDWRIALIPFYEAETDRERMKKFRAMRDLEAELMKKVPDWKVGTWKGLELYHDEHARFSEDLYQETELFEQPLTPIGRLRRFFSKNKSEEGKN